MPDEPDKERKRQEEDDHVVAPMNVEGMPWYRSGEPTPKNPNAEKMSTRNLIRYAFSAVGAGLLIVLIFGLAGAAFIWLCVNVWFR